MAKDYYEILGLSKNADALEIKKAYRNLALQYHPDRNKTKEAEAKFKEVTKAYEVLSDPQKKQTYDQFGHGAFEQGAGQQQGPFGGFGQQTGRYGPFTYTYTTNGGSPDFDFGGFSDPFEIFEQFFGGSPFGDRQSRQKRPVYALAIEFMDAVAGVEKQVTIDGKTQKIKIPAGVDDGSRIRFGEFDVVIEVRSDERFRREGVDIVSEKEISFPQAVLGDTLPIETIHGTVSLRIPSGTQPGTIFRLRAKGMPYLRGSGFGDHYVRMKVIIPKNVSNKQKELLREFEQEHGKKGWF